MKSPKELVEIDIFNLKSKKLKYHIEKLRKSRLEQNVPVSVNELNTSISLAMNELNSRSTKFIAITSLIIAIASLITTAYFSIITTCDIEQSL
jgi:hypothetical protein